jgi:hypothetical protein
MHTTKSYLYQEKSAPSVSWLKCMPLEQASSGIRIKYVSQLSTRLILFTFIIVQQKDVPGTGIQDLWNRCSKNSLCQLHGSSSITSSSRMVTARRADRWVWIIFAHHSKKPPEITNSHPMLNYVSLSITVIATPASKEFCWIPVLVAIFGPRLMPDACIKYSHDLNRALAHNFRATISHNRHNDIIHRHPEYRTSPTSCHSINISHSIIDRRTIKRLNYINTKLRFIPPCSKANI